MKNETRSLYETLIARAVRRVVSTIVPSGPSHSDEGLELGVLAEEAGLSPLHFHRIFRGMVGETPLELHRRLRMERAASWLSNSDTSITRIAFATGYETHESFTRAFRSAYAVAPSEMRAGAAAARQQGARLPVIELSAPSGIHFSEPMPPMAKALGAVGQHMKVEREVLRGMRVAAMAHRGPYNSISTAFERLGALLRPGGESQMVALYHDDPEAVAPADLRSHAGFSVSDDVGLPDGVTELRIPTGPYARTTHLGPYSLIGDTWAKLLGGWLPQSGLRLGDGPSFERYQNTPLTAAPEALRTDLLVSIQDAPSHR